MDGNRKFPPHVNLISGGFQAPGGVWSRQAGTGALEKALNKLDKHQPEKNDAGKPKKDELVDLLDLLDDEDEGMNQAQLKLPSSLK